jgi:Site-specific recombinases, DNA invertase Pin homologs
MENVVGYIRVSGAGQVDKEGPDRQRQDIAAFCSRNGLNHTAEYFECHTGTADTLERPKFTQMVEEILKRREIAGELALKQQPEALIISAVVIESFDRLARTLVVQEAAIERLRKAGIKLYICRNGTLVDAAGDDADPYRTLCRQMMGAFAEFEKANLCLRLHRGRLNKRAKTGRCEGKKPFGHYPGESEVLSHIKDLYLKDGQNYKDIADWLNLSAFKNRSGNPWTASNVRSILYPKSGRKRSLKKIVQAAAH